MKSVEVLCIPGDKVYTIVKPDSYNLGAYHHNILNYPQEKKVRAVTLSKNGIIYSLGDRSFTIDCVGVTIFLELEDALIALNKLKSENDEVINRYFERKFNHDNRS